jgi:hypothetical protein
VLNVLILALATIIFWFAFGFWFLLWLLPELNNPPL